MQLYSSSFSPYAARCRIQIFHKNLPVEIVAPPGGMGSAQLKSKNPIGKIPVLDLGEKALGESWAIMEYLEACHPSPAMRPSDAFEAAQLQALVRFTDLYLAPAMFPLFRALRGAIGPDAVAESLTALQAQLQILEPLLVRKVQHSRLALGEAYGVQLTLDLADAALLPIIWYSRILARHFGVADCIAALPATQGWWQQASTVPAAAKVLTEMEVGLKAAIPVLFPVTHSA